MGATCASTWASSVVSRPAVAHSHTDVASTAITTATIAMRIRLLILPWLTLATGSGRTWPTSLISDPTPLWCAWPQDALHPSRRITERSREDRFGHVIAKQRVDILLVGRRDRLLGLHHLEIVRHASRKPVACLHQFLVGQVARSRRDLQLLTIGLQVEECGAHVVVDLRAHVLRFRASLAEIGVGLREAALRPSSLKNRDDHRTRESVGGNAVRRGQTQHAVIGIDLQRWKLFAERRRAECLGGSHPFLCGEIVRPIPIRLGKSLFDGQVGHRHVRKLCTDSKRLTDRKAYQTCELES